MSEQTVSFSVDAKLKDAFSHVAEKNACDEVELLKAFMHEYVRQDARSRQYDEWFRRKVNIGLRQMAEGKAVSGDEANARLQAFKAACKSGTPAENPL